jgi:RNA polymerase sigma factor FliA
LVCHLDLPSSALEVSLIDSARFGPMALAMNRELSQKVVDLIDRLPPDEAALLRAVYYEGLSLQDAGQRQGISKSWASRLHAKAIERLGGMLTRHALP